MAEAESLSAEPKLMFGHPRGLLYLAFTEAWERFSYYGMIALLVLYMVNQLLLPGHVENIAGFTQVQAALQSLMGSPLSTQALASQIFGLYAGFVYFTPVLGGIVADRWIGQRSAVVIGALSMSAGHIAMAFDETFLLALLLLVIGAGFLKGNIASQVGALYPREDEARRTRGFVIFSTGINFGAVAGPLVCGLLAELYGWHYGFGIAAVFMLLGLVTYLHGYRYLPAKVQRRKQESKRLTIAEWRTVYALMAVMGITIFHTIAYNQRFNVLPVWIQQAVAPDLDGFRIPIPWYQSIDSIFSIVGVPVLLWIWSRLAKRGKEPSDLSKIGIGAWLAAASSLLLVAAIMAADGAPIHPIVPFLHFAGMGIAFLYQWPTTLALVSRAAPARMNSTLMGVVYLTLFVANIIVGWLGALYEKMSPARFWIMHGLIAAGGGLLVLLFGRRLSRSLNQA